MAILPPRRPSHSCPTGPERRRGASALPGSPGGRTEAHGGFRRLSALPAGLFSVAVAELLPGSASERSDVEHGRAARRAGWALTPDQRWHWACRQRHSRRNRHRRDCGSVGPRGAANASRWGAFLVTTARLSGWAGGARKGLLACRVRTPSARAVGPLLFLRTGSFPSSFLPCSHTVLAFHCRNSCICFWAVHALAVRDARLHSGVGAIECGQCKQPLRFV